MERITLIRYCEAKTKDELLKEVNEPNSFNYWHLFKHAGLVVGLYKKDIELKHLNKNNYIGEGGQFMDCKYYESLNNLVMHIEEKLIVDNSKPLNDYSLENLIDNYKNLGTVYLNTGRTMWSFEVDIKDIIGYAGIRVKSDFLCDGVELKPKARIFNIIKHQEEELKELPKSNLKDSDNIAYYLNTIKVYFNEPYGIHGIAHTKRILMLILIVCAGSNLNDIAKEMLNLCAYYHDIGRVNNDTDETHGKLSIDKIEKFNLLKGIREEEANIIKFIIEYHCINDTVAIEKLKETNIENKETALGLYLLFKDLDALDRVRINDLDISYLRHDQTKALVNIAWNLYYNMPG